MARIAAVLAMIAAFGSAGAATFAPGEETLLEVRYLGFVAGEARIAVGRPEGVIWPVFFEARTRGVAGLVDLREHLVSYWDTRSRLPRGSELRAFEAGDAHVDRARFDRGRGEATFVRERKGRRSEKRFPIPAGVQELTSAFLWLRLQPLAPGDRHALPIISGSRQFTLVAQVRGREEVSTPGGKFRCVRVDVTAPMSGPGAPRGDISLWLTDDPAHVIVRAAIPFSIGEVVALLTRYLPGDAGAAELRLRGAETSAPLPAAAPVAGPPPATLTPRAAAPGP
ncbi:DUF3108 domain-containing protein [Anaeromyxobacter terrae]|uniref:DUF3108 domain-containing protein n=1 Tax=Anaeromyxobacter terrae TaxID=2925406 RepID=UPI001F594DC3|nr:DUF3108 domain-containing protein [Anaeromyxobacter sp. SG22]